MRLPNILHKNYTQTENGYQLKLPLNIERIIPENDSVRLLSQFVEGMDLADLYSTYERIPENPSPRTLLKIILYAYMNGDFSSRSMEIRYRRDINFMIFSKALRFRIMLPLHVSAVFTLHLVQKEFLQNAVMRFTGWEKFPVTPFLLMVQKLKLMQTNILLSEKKQ